jgi:hypothetical protein
MIESTTPPPPLGLGPELLKRITFVNGALPKARVWACLPRGPAQRGVYEV